MVKVHPDTKEPILLPFRLSAFVPMNTLVTAGLLTPTGRVGTALWQTINQSLNVGVNWANANKSTPMTVNETAVGYVSAVSASVTVALGLKSLVNGRLFLERLVPFAAVATAGCLNVFLMRRNELT